MGEGEQINKFIVGEAGKRITVSTLGLSQTALKRFGRMSRV